jgi:hypothetical protein
MNAKQLENLLDCIELEQVSKFEKVLPNDSLKLDLPANRALEKTAEICLFFKNHNG